MMLPPSRHSVVAALQGQQQLASARCSCQQPQHAPGLLARQRQALGRSAGRWAAAAGAGCSAWEAALEAVAQQPEHQSG